MSFSDVQVTVLPAAKSVKRELTDISPPTQAIGSGDILESGTPKSKILKTEKEKYQRNINKYPLRPPCKCLRKCSDAVPQLRRIKIWQDFWRLSYNERKNCMWNLINRTPTKQHSTSSRKWLCTYNLILENGQKQMVCKTFFLGTLGYSKTSTVIQELLQTPPDSISPPGDKRGMAPKHHALTDDHIKLIKAHIRSYNPCISHYRREHAPRRLYLPTEITEKSMHQDYNAKYPNNTCSYVTYTRQVKSMGISFVKLGEEQCELCLSLDQAYHKREDGICTVDCEVCLKKNSHMDLYRQARSEYQQDSGAVKDRTIVRSVDLQKVVMLPRLPGVKSVCFTKRIIAFNETFAPVNAYITTSKSVCMLWHEGIAGRKCEEITSMFLKSLQVDRDYHHIVYYMDNCAGQNKNWSLLTGVVKLVNSGQVTAETITFKYLESGHTFMSADVIHAGVERQFRAMGNVYDFSDYIQCVKKIPNVDVLVPDNTDFKLMKGEQSAPKVSASADRPLLSECRQIQFRTGERSVFVKRHHSEDSFIEFDFLKKKCKLGEPAHPIRELARGIAQAKKDDIVRKLCPLMPTSRRVFWETLPASADSADLIDTDD